MSKKQQKRKPGRPPKGVDERIYCRVTPAEKTLYEQAAEAAGFRKFSDWIRATLTREARKLLNRARR